MAHKIALFRNTEFNFDCVGESSLEDAPTYVRLSEYFDVHFTLMPGDPVAEYRKNENRRRKIEEIKRLAQELEDE